LIAELPVGVPLAHESAPAQETVTKQASENGLPTSEQD
jgi:hypothetical protein